MEKSIFMKIVDGEIPSFKIYEDDKTLAFLDIFPKAPGHVLVVPKVQVDKVYDLTDFDYVAVFETARKVARRIEEVFGKRASLKVIGTDVPHAHIHVMPIDPENYVSGVVPERASDGDLAEVARKLRF